MVSPVVVKGASIALVGVLVMGVLGRIDSLVGERRLRGLEAVRSVEQSHASSQTVIGPLLLRDCTEEWEEATGSGADRRVAYEHEMRTVAQTPARLQLDGGTQSDVRYRGLFKVNTYVARVTAVAEFPNAVPLQAARLHPNSKLTCGRPRIAASLSDLRGLRTASVTLDGQALAVSPGTGFDHYPNGLQAVLPEDRDVDGHPAPMTVKVALEFVGTAQLAWVPAAGETRLTLKSDWRHPSFGGQFLPLSRTVRADGFDATWAVSALATSAPADVLKGAAPCALSSGDALDDEATGYGGGVVREAPHAPAGAGTTACLDTLAVSFIDPVNPYVLSDRAVKYGLLFVALTFVAVGLVEVLSGRRVHPVQYGLVGLALALFFLLLLSLSEHLPFAASYAAAASACALLLTFYARFMLGRLSAGLAFGGGIAALYGLLYVLLQMEQNALVIGAVMLFAALAAVMALTRQVDWYSLFQRWQAPAGSAGPVTPVAAARAAAHDPAASS